MNGRNSTQFAFRKDQKYQMVGCAVHIHFMQLGNLYWRVKLTEKFMEIESRAC